MHWAIFFSRPCARGRWGVRAPGTDGSLRPLQADLVSEHTVCTRTHSDGARQVPYRVTECEGSDSRRGAHVVAWGGWEVWGRAFCLGTTKAKGTGARPRGQMRLSTSLIVLGFKHWKFGFWHDYYERILRSDMKQFVLNKLTWSTT